MDNLSDDQVLIVNAAKARGRWTDAKIAGEIEARFGGEIHLSRINRITRGKVAASLQMRERLEAILELPLGTLTERPTPTHFYAKAPPTETKVIIIDKGISESLLDGKNPSFAEVVRNSQSFTPTSSEDKAKPREGLAHVHFFQPSCLFFIKWSGREERLLGYSRQPIRPRQQFQLVQGVSVLWAASYKFNHDRETHPMDRWLKEVSENDEDAANLFTDGPDSIMLQLLRYKLRLPRCDSVKMISFGSVTNNLIKAKKAAYTQYVFRVDVQLSEKPMDIQSFSVLGVPLKWIKESDDPETEFVGPEKQPLAMDIAAFNGLNSTSSEKEKSSARFVRDFDIGGCRE